MNNEKDNQNNANQMEDIEFVKKLALSYNLHLDRSEGSFMLNLSQFAKFKESLTIIEEITKKINGKVSINAVPNELHGEIFVEIPMLDTYGDDMKNLKQLMGNVNVMSIEPSINDTIIISFSINDLWEKVK